MLQGRRLFPSVPPVRACWAVLSTWRAAAMPTPQHPTPGSGADQVLRIALLSAKGHNCSSAPSSSRTAGRIAVGLLTSSDSRRLTMFTLVSTVSGKYSLPLQKLCGNSKLKGLGSSLVFPSFSLQSTIEVIWLSFPLCVSKATLAWSMPSGWLWCCYFLLCSSSSCGKGETTGMRQHSPGE